MECAELARGGARDGGKKAETHSGLRNLAGLS